VLRIFLDANIYVRLFEVLQFRSLLDTLRDLRPHILVTERIVAEVERTKLTAAKRFFTSQLGKIFVTRAEIPDLLRESVSGDLRKIIRRADTRVRNLNTIRQDVEAVVSATLDAIGENRDPISLELEGLFATAKAPSAAGLNRARDRREQGDPPGKPNNPLGDQIS